MHETRGWFLDATAARVFAAVWLAVVILYGLWRSRGAAKPDSIRESGPIF